MTCFMARTDWREFDDPHHVQVRIFVGVDPDHYQSAGTIILEADQVQDFVALVNAQPPDSILEPEEDTDPIKTDWIRAAVERHKSDLEHG